MHSSKNSSQQQYIDFSYAIAISFSYLLMKNQICNKKILRENSWKTDSCSLYSFFSKFKVFFTNSEAFESSIICYFLTCWAWFSWQETHVQKQEKFWSWKQWLQRKHLKADKNCEDTQDCNKKIRKKLLIKQN